MKAAIGYILSTVWTLVVCIDNDFDHFPQSVEQVHASTDVNDGVRLIVNDIMTKERSISRFSRSSSQCWYASITALSRLINLDAKSLVTSGSAYCATMTENQLDILALELTSCEFFKSRREMFIAGQSSDDSISITGDAISTCPLGTYNPSLPYEVSVCLEQLTEHAHAIYHQIRLHTKTLCRDLADEMLQRQREESTRMILHASTTLAHQIQAVLDGTSSTIEQLNLQSILLQNQSHIIREQQRELEEIHEVRKREELSQSLLMKERQVEFEQMFEALRTEEVEADRLRKLREEDTLSLLQRQTDLMEQQRAEFEEMYKARAEMMEQKIKEQMRELSQMQELITSANSQMKPLSAIEAYVKFATDGFNVFNTVLNFFISMNAVWLCSSLPVVKEIKKRLFGVIILGFVVELSAIFYPECELLVAFGQTDAIGRIRYWTRVCGIATLSVSSLMLCLLPSSADTGQSAPTMDDLLRSQLEFVSKLNASQMESIVRAESKARTHEKHMDPRTRYVRNFHPVSGSRKSSSPRQLSSTRTHMRSVTPHDDSSALDVKVKPTVAKTKQARPTNAVACLKEMQRDYNKSGSNDDSTRSQGEPSSASPEAPKDNRKRKFSDIWDGFKDEVMLHDAQHDNQSVSSISTGSSSSRTNSRIQKRQR